MDKLVFDIETKNTFADVGGEENIDKLEVSMICVYSYDRGDFFAFSEYEINEATELFKRAGLLIGHSINHFDVPVLKKYFSFEIASIPTVDLLEEIQAGFGRRVGLDALAKTNVGAGKTHHGLEATRMYRDGEIEELRNYCMNDVKLTKALYELAERQGFLMVPERTTGQLVSVSLNWKEKLLDAHLMQSLW